MKKIILITIGLFLVACSENTKTESTKKEETKKVETKQSVAPAVTKTIEIAEPKQIVSKSGEEIYMVCAACHGKNAEKKAMGKSQIIKGWEINKTVKALNGYKDGSYGASMKGLMKGQVSKLSDEDIQKVSQYISTL